MAPDETVNTISSRSRAHKPAARRAFSITFSSNREADSKAGTDSRYFENKSVRCDLIHFIFFDAPVEAYTRL
jgi:hypothetical protein